MAGRGTNRIAAVEIDQKIGLTVNKLKNKASLHKELARIDLPVHGTINYQKSGKQHGITNLNIKVAPGVISW